MGRRRRIMVPCGMRLERIFVRKGKNTRLRVLAVLGVLEAVELEVEDEVDAYGCE